MEGATVSLAGVGVAVASLTGSVVVGVVSVTGVLLRTGVSDAGAIIGLLDVVGVVLLSVGPGTGGVALLSVGVGTGGVGLPLLRVGVAGLAVNSELAVGDAGVVISTLTTSEVGVAVGAGVVVTGCIMLGSVPVTGMLVLLGSGVALLTVGCVILFTATYGRAIIKPTKVTAISV